MTEELRSILEAHRIARHATSTATRAYENSAEADPNAEAKIDGLLADELRAELAVLSFPAVEPGDSRAKAKWIALSFIDPRDFTNHHMNALMIGWRDTALT